MNEKAAVTVGLLVGIAVTGIIIILTMPLAVELGIWIGRNWL